MRKEAEQRSILEFKGYLTEKDYRVIVSRRTNLTLDEIESRVAKIQMAAEKGLIQYLSERQQQALMILYPQNLRLPKLVEAARSMYVTPGVIVRMERRLMRNLDKLLNSQTPQT